MSLPQDSITAECSICHTVTTDWQNFEGNTLCHDCMQDVTKDLTNYKTTC